MQNSSRKRVQVTSPLKKAAGPFFLLVLAALPAFAEQKPYDYVIKDALVFEGESLVPVKRDVAIAGDQIAQMGEVPREEGREVIEADGLVLSPGFIDIHTHSDFNPFVYPNLGNKVLQGVTTEVVGNCGMSAAPVEGSHAGEIKNVWRREGVEIPAEVPWESFKEYMGEAEFQGLETNFVGLVGHGNLRSSVIGMAPRQAAPEEIESMRKLLAASLEEGASGISFGLTYLPGVFANREELVTLCREAAEQDALCVFHIRGEGRNLLEAIREAIEVGKEANARTHISHLKAQGEENWPKIEEAFRMIESAREEGLRLTADAYPYHASFAELGVILPKEIYEDPNRVTRLKDPNERRATLPLLEKYFNDEPASWDRIRVATVVSEKNQPLQGKSLVEIARIVNKTQIEALVDLLAEEEFKVSAFYFSQSEAIVNKVLSKPYVAVGSDSIADGSAVPHPRAYGTFPRRLGQCPKNQPVTTTPCWGERISQMTALPAKILGLRNRGRIGTGLFADLVLFDPLTVQDRAGYENPKVPPEGIKWVFVNGKPAVREGEYQPVHAGLFL